MGFLRDLDNLRNLNSSQRVLRMRVNQKAQNMLRDLRNNIFLWAVYCVVLVIMSVFSFELLDLQTPLQDCKPSQENNFCKEEIRIENEMSKNIEFISDCSRGQAIWLICYMLTAFVKLMVNICTFKKVSNLTYNTMAEVKAAKE